MKNSKRFSAAAWQAGSFLTARQLDACRALFSEQAVRLALSVIFLPRLAEHLAEQGPALTGAYLAPMEQARLASFGFAKRQLEWLGGRIAVKQAAMQTLASSAGQPCYRDWRVEAEDSGRPYLQGGGQSGPILPVISISHSGRYAGGLALRGQSCGLDLQQITPKVVTVRERFAADAELDVLLAHPELRATGDAARLTCLWAAKESLRKAIVRQPVVGFTELTLCGLRGDLRHGVTCLFSCPRVTSSLLPTFLAMRDDVVCAMTVMGKHSLPGGAGGASAPESR